MDNGLPKKILDLLDIGLHYHKLGKFDKAIKAYNKALKINSFQPDALWLKGLVLMEFSKFNESINLLKLAIKKRPKDAKIINDLGIVYEKAGNNELAFMTFQHAISIDNNLPQAHINLSRYHLQKNNYDESLNQIDCAIKLDSKMAEAHNTKGMILEKLDKPKEALSSFSNALLNEPNNPDILINQVRVLCDLGHFEDALKNLFHAQNNLEESSSKWNDSLLMYGLILHKKGEYVLAKDKYDQVLKKDPLHFEALVNRADINLIFGDINGSYQDYYSALRVQEDSPDVIYNLSRLLLLEGKFSKGWLKFESRWQTAQFKRHFKGRSIIKWDGVKYDGLNLLLWGEQGLGDQILFLSQLEELLSMKIYPTIEVDERLVKVISRSFPGLKIFPYGETPSDLFDKLNAQISLGSLGSVIFKESSYKVSSLSFIKPDEYKTKELRKKYLEKSGDKLLIGISWMSINKQFGSIKSLPLSNWGKILSFNDVKYYSLQYGKVIKEVEQWNENNKTYINTDPYLDHILDIDLALSQINAMDIIITTSNTTAHLAGSIGKETWVMVPKVPEWRWGIKGSRSQWYNSVKIFRQEKQFNWEQVVETVYKELNIFIKNKKLDK